MATKKIDEIKTHSLFEGLFVINGELLSKIEQDMRDDNYDISQPIILATWEGQEEPVCIDGHTRLKAATNAGIEEVAVYSYEFETEEDALEYAIRLQTNRRNLSDGDLIHCIERLHERRPRGGDRRSADVKESTPQSCGNKQGRSAAAKQTADLLNISPRKVEQALTVINHGSPQVKEALQNNEISINKAYQKTQAARKKAEAESLTENSEGQTADESPEAEEADESQALKFDAPVFISMKHFGALHQLGGFVEEHLDTAVERYLESQRDVYTGVPVKAEPEDGAADHIAPSTGDDEHNEPEDEEEEWFDPDEYGE